MKSTKRSAADASMISATSPLIEQPMSRQKTISLPSQESQYLSNSPSFLAAATNPMLALLPISVQLSEKKCQGLLTLKAIKEMNVQIALFCHTEYYAELESVKLSKDAGLWSMHSHACSITDVNCRNNTRKNVCNACWAILCSKKFNWSKEKKRLIEKHKKITDVKILLRPSATIDLTREARIVLLKGFVKTGEKFFSTAGKELRQNAIFRLRYDSTRLALNSVQSDNDFFSTFKAQYIGSKNVSLALSFLELAVGRSAGHRNGRIPEKAMDFLTAVQCNSPAVFRMLSKNLCGPTERHLLR